MANMTLAPRYQGEAVDLVLTITASGTPIDLTGATVVARIGVRGNELIKSPTVTLTTPAAGVITVALAATDTQLAPGAYTLEVRRTSGSPLTLAVGTLTILDSLFFEG
jgi:hypothetical protein